MKYKIGTLLIANKAVNSAYEYYRHFSTVATAFKWGRQPFLLRYNNTILVIDYEAIWLGAADTNYRVWIDGIDGYMNKEVLERADYYEVVK